MSSQGPGKGSAKGVLPAPPQAFLAKRRQDCYFCYLPCFFMLSSTGQGSACLHHLLLARIHLQPLPLPLQPQHLRGAWLPSRLQYPPLLQVSSHVASPDFGAEAACFSIVQPTLFRFSAQGSLQYCFILPAPLELQGAGGCGKKSRVARCLQRCLVAPVIPPVNKGERQCWIIGQAASLALLHRWPKAGPEDSLPAMLKPDTATAWLLLGKNTPLLSLLHLG